jgi:hypothetical protein
MEPPPRLGDVLAEIRRRRREYARSPELVLPDRSPIARPDFAAVLRVGAAIVADDGRLTAAAIARRLGWKSLSRVRAAIQGLRCTGSWPWILQSEADDAR